MNKINEDSLDEFLTTILTFEKFDEIFKEKLPKDITGYIYKFVEPYCKECSKCCKLCLFYCNISCLRFENRNVCCRWEFNEEIRRYEIGDVEIEEESEDNFDIE
mgnify:CR=1 FL=1